MEKICDFEICVLKKMKIKKKRKKEKGFTGREESPAYPLYKYYL